VGIDGIRVTKAAIIHPKKWTMAIVVKYPAAHFTHFAKPITDGLAA